MDIDRLRQLAGMRTVNEADEYDQKLALTTLFQEIGPYFKKEGDNVYTFGPRLGQYRTHEYDMLSNALTRMSPNYNGLEQVVNNGAEGGVYKGEVRGQPVTITLESPHDPRGLMVKFTIEFGGGDAEEM